MSKLVITVDDDPLIRALTRAILQDADFEVLEAENGLQASEMIDNKVATGEELSLIVLDVVMPGMNGFELLARLRADPKTENIPVLMLTGEDKSEDIMKGYTTGATYYITKPFTRQQLLYGIKLVLGGK